MTGEFQAYIELLHLFLAHRDDIVDRIQGLLNAQRKPIEYLLDRPLLSHAFEDCFYRVAGITSDQARLRGQLQDAHWASGFRPREIPGIHNGLTDPAEMMIRGFHLWQQTRWPGRNGRLRYAQTLFNLYVIGCLELLSMRLWDDDSRNAGDRLSRVQGVLDELWTVQPADQPVLVRDARWLIQLAQSPATDDLAAYFVVASAIAETFPIEERLEIHMAGVRLAGGHLRSQIRHYSLQRAVPFDEHGVVLSTRNSNALDFALMIQDLVPLLERYERACLHDDEQERRELAGVICQGLSPDPELFLNRGPLLGAYSMIEHLFVATDSEGNTALTPMGQRHVGLVQEYDARISQVSKPLLEDCIRFRPVAGTYSPYGIVYGFSSDLIEHMTLRTLVPDAMVQFSLEDVFVDGGADKLAWVSGWRKLPHLTADLVQRFDYPQQFAEDVFERMEQALRRRVSADETNDVHPVGRLFLVSEGQVQAGSEASAIADLPARYVGSSDTQLVAAHKANYRDETLLASERREGKCLVSYKTPGGWTAITKDILTEVSATGTDVKVAGLPQSAVNALKVMYPDLIAVPQNVPAG